MFEIEQMEKQFDYSLVDNDTADFLRSCEYEINGIAEDARVKFGAVLIKAQDELAKKGYGIFIEWVTSGGISKDDAYYYINLNRTSRNLDKRNKDNFLKAPKTVQKKVMQKNTPDEVKEAVLSGEVKTNKELEKMQREIEEKNELISKREKENEILQSKLEEVENQEPKTIEREVIKEVVPDNVKIQLERYKAEAERNTKSVESLRKELNRYTEAFSDPSQAYDEKQVKKLERESTINAYKLAINIQSFIEDNAVETYKVSSVIKSNEPAKKRLEENIDLLEDFTTNLKAILNGRIVTN